MSPHQPEGQTEHLGEKLQELRRKKPLEKTNTDPYSDSGYPAGGERTRPGRDAYEKPTREKDD
ncbi:hypothetical protein [Bordetella genomosp. 4]|uniref:hypothetical protein n=1 Tax=Bordetella genomosp. 4 TaxID=463044 RepID=UPI000B9E44FB|nr:hypothetical protein [Bordetella genomosp. 4]OZI49641.1 hypothetical protein CAL21_08745 [Bordetella genomosp. 4]